MTAHEVADYLQRHPEFFEQYADLFASVTIPHPHGGRAISLTERQMITLRERHRALELKLADMVRYSQENEAIAEKLQRWTRSMLLQRNARSLPDNLMASLTEIFNIPYVGLRVWEASDDYADLPCTQPVPVGLINYANQLLTPYCGMPLEANSSALALVEAPIESMALMALRRDGAADAFGLLVFGAPDTQRFHAGMGTDFLTRIGESASASLTRLLS